MKHAKWLILPAVALTFSLAGCGSSGESTVIEAPQQSEQEIANADAAYEQQYADQAQSYEGGQ